MNGAKGFHGSLPGVMGYLGIDGVWDGARGYLPPG